MREFEKIKLGKRKLCVHVLIKTVSKRNVSGPPGALVQNKKKTFGKLNVYVSCFSIKRIDQIKIGKISEPGLATESCSPVVSLSFSLSLSLSLFSLSLPLSLSED